MCSKNVAIHIITAIRFGNVVIWSAIKALLLLVNNTCTHGNLMTLTINGWMACIFNKLDTFMKNGIKAARITITNVTAYYLTKIFKNCLHCST